VNTRNWSCGKGVARLEVDRISVVQGGTIENEWLTAAAHGKKYGPPAPPRDGSNVTGDLSNMFIGAE
jgi:hypothetical protein